MSAQHVAAHTMILPIMPWCRIDGAYEVDDITIIPYRGPIDDVDDSIQDALARVLSPYRDIQGRPVDHAAPCSIR